MPKKIQTPMEVELKLIALNNPLLAFEEQVLPLLDGQVEVSKKTLKNQYSVSYTHLTLPTSDLV